MTKRSLFVMPGPPLRGTFSSAPRRSVSGPAHVEQSHYLRVYMGNLQQKLEADPARPQHLITETGVGYRLMA